MATMNILKENVIFESELKDILKNKMRCLMSQSYNMFKEYQNVTNQSYFDITQDIHVDGGETFHLTIHLSNKKDSITCSVKTPHGITLELSAVFGEEVEETVVNVSEEEAENLTSVTQKYKAPEKEEPPQKKEQPPVARKYGTGHRIPPDVRAKIAEHCRNGQPIQWIMDNYTISRTTVHNIAKEYGIEKERISKGPDAESSKRLVRYSDDIVTGFAKGFTVLYLSNLYQISRSALSNFKFSHKGAIETRKKELEEKELGLVKQTADDLEQNQNPGMDKESFIIEDLIKGELNTIEIAAKYQTTSAIVDKIADLNGALINKKKAYMQSKKRNPKNDPSNGGDATAESLNKLKEHFGGK